MNELARETSPYLFQHANNPVNWKAWNPLTLSEALTSNKLIIISIGYSACHWCHVMEHETFEDHEAAQTMNAHFINIKVDREERPDVDAIYMKAIQIMTARGGWPLNIVALPDGRPVWGGTYFSKIEWINTLEQLQQLYHSTPTKMIEYAEKLHQALQTVSVSFSKLDGIKNPETFCYDSIILDNLVEKWSRSFDDEFGGMARAPKFMMPNNYEFLLQYGYLNNNQKILDFVDLTLTKMAYGGLFDTIGGGFSRYSVDMKWHVPHFEKMLYDNGQLVSLYAKAYKLTKNPLYKTVIEKTLHFVLTELTNSEGGFFCALDADSLNAALHLEEGAFYVWKKPELLSILKEDFDLFAAVFNINAFGHWEDENYVLIQRESLEEVAQQHNIPLEQLQTKKEIWEKLLFAERQKRNRPRLDDKCLTSWNAMMLRGYIEAFKALQNESYRAAALKNAQYIEKNLWAAEGNLWHNIKNEKPSINGFLEDYAFVIDSFIALFEITFDEKWLRRAKQLTDYCCDHFYDNDTLFFAFTSNQDDHLISRHFETEDNVIPASNSVMAHNLTRLSVYFHNSFYEKIAMQMLERIMPSIDYSSAFSNWLQLFLQLSENHKELAITGKNAEQFANEIHQNYSPNIVVMATSERATTLPFLEHRFDENKTQFFVCQNKSCQLPTDDFQTVKSNLRINR